MYEKIRMDVRSLLNTHYGHNVLSLTVAGISPFQSKISTCAIMFIFVVIPGAQLFFKCVYIVISWPNLDKIIPCLPPLLIGFMSIVKMMNVLIFGSKVKQMLIEMLISVDRILSSGELKIMENHAKRSKKFMVYWAAYLYTTTGVYLLLPILPQIFDPNKQRPRELPSPAYYWIDIEENYVLLATHAWVAPFLVVTSLIATDTLFVSTVEYACGIFEVVSHNLVEAINNEEEEWKRGFTKKIDDITYGKIAECIKRHQEAIDFAENVQHFFKGSFLFTSGCYVLTLSSTGIQMVSHAREYHLLTSQISVVGAQLINMFIDNYFAQRLLDCSFSVYENIFNSKWYVVSIRAQKLLHVVAMRSSRPSTVTIGGLYVMSIQHFSSLLQASSSYFTILQSVQ